MRNWHIECQTAINHHLLPCFIGFLSRCNDVKGKSASSNFTKAIDEAIKKEKNIETERMSYMTYEMKLQEMQDFGYNKGKTEGKLKAGLN